MPHLILPKDDLKRIIRERRRCGGDRYDEVWDGVYVISPLANNEHMFVATRLTIAFAAVAPEAIVLAGCNVSDDADAWTKNFRVPDVAVFLPGNPAEDRDTHWYGGPDFAVEILSPGDRARKKLDFYARVGVRELLLVDRNPWRLELYRRDPGVARLALVGTSEPDTAAAIASDVLLLTFRLIPAAPRPQIEVVRASDGQTWLA